MIKKKKKQKGNSVFKEGKPTHCKSCGKELVQTNIGGDRQFCHNKCRDNYHNSEKVRKARKREKFCLNCGEELKQPKRGRAKEYCNKKCRSRAWSANNKKYNNDRYKQWAYGITNQDYERMLKEQNYSCAICGVKYNNKRTKDLYIDHCHNTGEVRGLLCANCNLGIGGLKDNSQIVMKAYFYLRKFENDSSRN